MIQIIGLRPFFNKKKDKEDTKHELLANCESVPKLFENLSTITETIPEMQRWNVFFTVANCVDPRLCKGQLRRFQSQEIFHFDIDNCDFTKTEQYIKTYFQITGLDRTKSVVVRSGNGLQFHSQLAKPFDSATYFNEKRAQYRAICERIDKALAEQKLTGNADPSVWSPARLMRLPNTLNKKKGKQDRIAALLEGQLAPQEFNWEAASDIKELDQTEHVKDWDDSKAPKLDHKEMYAKCAFLQASVNGAEKFREPHFYAALSIIGRMDNGLERAKKLRDAIKTASPESSVATFADSDVEKKLKQALENSGPRTCKNIDSIWGKCETCPMYKKCVSPVALKGAEHIATKETGFHIHTKEGPKPCYTDLLKYFDQKFKHKTLDQNALVFVWKDTHYELMSKHQILSFAQDHFKPAAKSGMCDEFLRLVQRTNLVNSDFFASNLNGKMNFKNGVYDFHTKELTPHTHEIGFRYVLPYEYDPHAPAPRFEKFLDEITDGDANLRAILEEFGGFALSGDEYWIHKTLFLLGDGSNGKSTYIDVLKMCAGKGNYSTVSLKDLRSENNRQLLEGKLFNIAPELSKDALRDTEKFKYLSDGSEITVKLMYNQPYQIRNRAKMIYGCNDIPPSDDPSYGFMRRMVIVPFNRTFEGDQKDDQIIHKLEKELAGIMNIFIRGYERLLKNRNFTKAETSEAEKEWYKMDNNMVQEFLEDCPEIVIHPLNGRCHFAPIYEIRKKFDMWAVDNGVLRETEKITMNMFGRMFQKAVEKGTARRGKKRMGEITKRGYWDVELR